MTERATADPILEVRDLEKRFGGIHALRGVSFRVTPGEVLGIIGPNGSGKTTLVNCLTGFVRPSAGTIRFRGRDLTRLPPHRIAGMGLARTFQVTRPFGSLTAFQNLVVPLRSSRVRRGGGWRGGGRHGDLDATAIDLLEDIGFERDSTVPFQLAGSLPTGYRKRLELARCIALRPDAILCDEILSGLSLTEIASLLPLIERLRDEGVAFVMIEHRLRDLFRLADRVLVLAQGMPIAQGSPETVLEAPAVRDAYLGPEEEPP